ncbi:MAG: T9SS type A sorting domain-containing protein [Flavobacteriales bacterium]
MKKTIYYLFFLISSYNVFSQNFFFEPIDEKGLTNEALADFTNIQTQIIKHSDIDNDGDIDLLIYGREGNDMMMFLYKNNGHGRFTKVEHTNLPKVNIRLIEFVDLNGDHVDDIFLMAYGYDNKVYLNNGRGIFNEIPNNGLEEFRISKIEFGDINGDSYLDLILKLGTSSASINDRWKMLLNDGSGIFNKSTNIPIDSNNISRLILEDINNDNVADIFISTLNTYTKLWYLNNGKGEFTQLQQPLLENEDFNTIKYLDIDNDGDLDFISDKNKTLFYNNGEGIFDRKKIIFNNSNFSHNSINAIDMNKDGDFDLLTHRNDGTNVIFYNDGFENFTDSITIASSKKMISSSSILDANGDGYQDILINGKNHYSDEYALNLYINDQSNNFNQLQNAPIPNLSHSSIDYGDIDGDGDEDLIISGNSNNSTHNSKSVIQVYKNENGKFIKQENSSIKDTVLATVKFVDVDGDHDLDIFVSGRFPESHFSQSTKSKIYKNDGLGNFIEFKGHQIEDFYFTTIHVLDADGDADMDIFITGSKDPHIEKYNQYLYLNQGDGTYEKGWESPYLYYKEATVAFGDIDGDLDEDLIMNGTYNNEQICKLFTNDGKGNYTLQSNTPFIGVVESKIEFGDIDGDGDLDLFIIGFNLLNMSREHVQIYINNGQGIFEEKKEHPVKLLSYESLKLIDLDADNDLDVFVTGRNNNSQEKHHTFIYENDGLGNFKVQPDHSIPGIVFGSVAFSDFDNDGHPDLCISGIGQEHQPLTRFYHNSTCSSIDYSITKIDSTLSVNFKNGSSYQWLNCDNNNKPIEKETNDNFSPLENGDYAVIIEKNNCRDTSSCFTFNKYADLEPMDGFIFSYYPNPTNNTVNIEFHEAIHNVELTLTNIQGQLIRSKKISKSFKTTIDLGAAKGIYFLTISSNKGTKTIKLVKK